MIRVILLIDCSSEFDRRLLRGIMRYSKENGSWLFYRMPSSLRSGSDREKLVLDWAKEWKADAVIGRWDEDKVEMLSVLDIPVVLQNYRHRSAVHSNLTGDYFGTGKMAARFFIRKKFRNFAYFGVRDIVWSEERHSGFREEIEHHGYQCHSFLAQPLERESEIREAVRNWLEELPKPVALFSCDDAHALFITETCRIANIHIPGEISLLGVDNDELLCEISDPPISSIELDVEEGGYMTCKMLHERILSGNRNPFSMVIKPNGIIQRKSTQKYDIDDPYIERIIDYMEEHYASDITIDRLLKIVPLSRRSLELRFKKGTGNTPYQFLIECRLQHFSHLLLTTKKPVYEIAYEVGFKDGSNYSRIFHKFFGCSPQEYRNSKANQ